MEIMTEPTVRIGYINIYFRDNRYYSGEVYWTYIDAARRGKESGFYVNTVRIEWKELGHED